MAMNVTSKLLQNMLREKKANTFNILLHGNVTCDLDCLRYLCMSPVKNGIIFSLFLCALEF